MATAIGTWNPTPTSLTLIRPQSDDHTEAGPPTFEEPIQAVNVAPEPEIEESVRFRPLRLFATGGQGLVYVAHDRQLGREVALKELKPRNSDRKITRHRFVREAEITGSLEHPGVVPVYALGRHADGRPYYAMRLIQGRTLHDAVQHYYSPELKVTAVEKNLLFRKLLQRFVSVCQTVAYAHSRGIIHRDLKPANVLLGQYGEALVADWGLARPFHPTDGCGLDTDIGMEPEPDDHASNATLMGSALGTPAYMSPEQSEGRWDKVGPTSDVYSLGATLFTILTGQAPMPKLPWPEAHRRIMTGDFPSPAQLNPKTPRGLVAICRKAMALKPADRYSSALALAEDIEHWLADEPVTAEPAPLAERASRWVRRHRTLVWTMAVLWLTAGIALAIGLVVVDGWRVSNDIAHQRTRTVLDRTQSRIVDEWLGRQTELLPEHKEFLETALSDYEMLAQETGSDASTRLAVVRAYRRVGEIRHRLGEQAAAANALAEAESRIFQLNDSVEARTELARLRAAQGSFEKSGKRLEVAEMHFAEALKLFSELAAEPVAAPSIRRELAAAYNNRAAALSDLQRGAEAVAAFESALAIAQQLAAEKPDSNEAARELAAAYSHLGQCQRLYGLTDAAEANLKLAANVAGKLVARAPQHPPYHEELASASHKLGRLYYESKKWNDAKHWLSLACTHYDKLMTWYPNVPAYRLELAGAANNVGRIEMHGGGRADAAIPYFDRALAALKPLANRESTIRFDHVLRAAYAGRAEALSRAGYHELAIAAWADAIAASPEKADVYRTHQALELLHCSRVAEAIQIAEDIARNDMRTPIAVYNCACIYAQAASRQAESATTYKNRAVELLKELAERGYFKDPAKIKALDADEDFAPLREWPEFKSFRDSLN